MQIRNTRRAARGFTMVEILVTLSMAGVLSSVALPTFSNAWRKTCQNSPRACPAGAPSSTTTVVSPRP